MTAHFRTREVFNHIDITSDASSAVGRITSIATSWTVFTGRSSQVFVVGTGTSELAFSRSEEAEIGTGTSLDA